MQFALDPAFVATYQSRRAPFGFNGLGELTYKRTYSRIKADGTQEEWYETVERVVNGVYRMQQRHIELHRLGWDADKAQTSAREMYDRIWNMKFLPPGRGLWAMGSPMTEERGVYAALFNCAACTTGKLATEGAEAFAWLMDASMLGVGVGFDTAGAGTVVVQRPHEPEELYVIPDTREGWVESVRRLLNSYVVPQRPRVVFDYALVRPAGEPIKGFGGVASGPGPLIELHEALRAVLEPGIGAPITVTHVVDIANLIAKCVVAGNVRRSALLSAGPNDAEYLDLKNYAVNPHRATYGWTSNNSVLADVGMDYAESAERIRINGEPGFLWLENMRKYGRMGELKADPNVIASNPCVTGDTPILTKAGWCEIGNLTGNPVDVWNGFEWSRVVPSVTGFDQPLVEVTLSSGRSLRCTPAHKFVIATDYHGATERLSASELVPGMKLIKHAWPVLECGEEVDEGVAYTTGFAAGDGMEGYNHLWLYGEKRECASRMAGSLTGGLFTTSTGGQKQAFRYDTDFPSVDKSFVPHGWNVAARLEWFAGLLDADGTVCNEGQVQVTSVNRDFLLEVQLMLTTLGVDSKVRPGNPAGLRKLPDGKGGFAEYECQDCFRLLVNAAQVQSLVQLGLETTRLDLSHIPQRDASRFVTVESVVSAGVAAEVYCFTEPLRNLGAFNGVVTGQCGEIPLEDREKCNICESFPARHESLEDFKRTLKFAYLYCKTVTLSVFEWPESNRVMLKNRRIGVSQSGVQQFVAKHGLNTFKQWCEEGYATLEHYDEVYSNWFAIPRSIRLTTCKPSGTVSLLAGATPGVHWPESRYYIRRMRLSKQSDLLHALRAAQYPIEDAFGSEDTTVVVEIPVALEGEIRTLDDVSMWEQLQFGAFMQRYWADNMVSQTVTFDPEREGPQLAAALNYAQYHLKSVSFLPRLEAGAFPQMPYEAITKEEYERRSAALRPLNFGATAEAAEAERFCSNDTCTF
jgi:ribonucleotide reductase alpha subunit